METRIPGRRRRTCRVVSFALLALSGAALAAPGDLDPAFGVQGRVLVRNNNADDAVYSVAQQADGKLLLGLEVLSNEVESFTVSRLNADGAVDTAFGSGGTAQIAVPDHFGRTRAVLQLRDGKILVAGPAHEFVEPFRRRFAFARYESDGAPDRSFGSQGVVVMDFGTDDTWLAAVVEQPDGRLVAAGSVRQPPAPEDTAFVRLNPDGSLDTTFGNNGRLVVNLGGTVGFGAIGYDAADALVRLPDGRLLAAGTLRDNTSWRVVLARLTAAGQLDTTFGSAGRLLPDLGQAFQNAVRLAPQTDRGLVLASRVTGTSNACALAVMRMDTDGRPDPTFGTAGVARLPYASCMDNPLLTGVIVAPDNSIFVADATDGDFWYYGAGRVRHLDTAGRVDLGFGVNGAALIDVGVDDAASNMTDSSGSGIVLQPDGRIVIASTAVLDHEFTAGYGWGDGPVEHASFAVARLRANGSSPGLVGLKRSDVAVRESSGSAVLLVRRTGGATGIVGVDYETAGDTATSGIDFTATSGTLTWGDGDASDKTITIAIRDDSTLEEIESLRLTLTNPSGGAGLTASVALIGIDDSAQPPTQPPAGDSSGGGGGAADWLVLLALLIACCRRGLNVDALLPPRGPDPPKPGQVGISSVPGRWQRTVQLGPHVERDVY